MTRGGDFDDLDDFFARPKAPRSVATLDAPRSTRPPKPARSTSAKPTSAGRQAPKRAAKATKVAPEPRVAKAPSSAPSRPAQRRTARPAPAAPSRSTRTGPARTDPVRSAPARPARPAPRPARPAPRPPRARPAALDGTQSLRRTKHRLIGFVLFICLLVAGIGARLVDAQVINRKTYTAYGAKTRDGFRDIPAGRGAIYDRSGQAFALSVAQPNVVADPVSIKHPKATAKALAPILRLDESELAVTLAKRPSRYQVLLPTASTKVVDKVKALHLPGITFENQYVRKDPGGVLARAVVGSTYADGKTDKHHRQGQTGVERAYESQLLGTPGKVSFEKGRWGNTIAGTPEKVKAAKPGTDLYLTLDQSLQYATEEALSRQVLNTGAKQGMAIISRPSTGEVLAMASVAMNADGTVSNTGDNRPVSTEFEPGSVNKMITVAGAMEDGVVTPDTPIEVPDHLQLYDHNFTDHDPHPTSTWSPTDILVTSSNIGTIKIARMLGKDRVDQYLRAFGFGTSTHAFPGEVDGDMLPLAKWSGTSIGAIPIGQGISVTALQMLAAYNVIANDGVYVSPKLIAATDEGAGKVVTAASKHRRVVSATTAIAMRQMLAKVVTDGTGKPARVPGYVAYGKTGTARIPQVAPHADPKDAYQDSAGRYHYESSFVGGIDGADLSIIVTIQDAQTSIYGSTLAAPVFAQLASLTLRHEQIPPPSLVTSATGAVPELSDSAKDLDTEDPGLVTETTQG